MSNIRKVFVIVSGLCALGVGVALRPTRGEPAAPSVAIKITATTTLADVVVRLDRFTNAKVVVADADKSLAHRYTFPPFLVGTSLQLSPVPKALRYLTGIGWEGSHLTSANRRKGGTQYQLARTPYVFEDGREKYWVCNNRQWDWKWEKPKGGPAGGIITIFSRLQPDGDIVAGRKFELDEVRNDATFETLLDLVKAKTGVTINFVPYDRQFLEVRSRPAPGVPADSSIPKRIPMRASAIPDHLRPHLTGELTLGGFLSIVTIGLSAHTRPAKTDWRWSSSRSAGEVIYTIRDYAHVEPE